MSPANPSNRRIAFWLVAPFLLWNFTFVVLPLLAVMVQSLHPLSKDYDILPNWTLDNYRHALEPELLSVVCRSAGYALITTLLCLLLGYPLAYFIASSRGNNKSRLLMLVVLPFWTSYLLRALAWMTVLQTDGTANTVLLGLGLIREPLRLLNTPLTVVLGLTYGFLPFTTLPIYTRLEQMDRGLLEAAADLGASPFQVFRKIVWPLSLPGVIAGSLITFVPAMGDFVTPELMGGPQTQMIGNLIQQQFLALFNWPMGSALSLVLMAIMVTGVLVYQRLAAGNTQSDGTPTEGLEIQPA